MAVPAVLGGCYPYHYMGNAEERAFFTGDGDKKPLGILDETGGAQLGVETASQTAITFDEIFDLYYSLKSPYRRNAQFVCNETILLQLMKLKDKNDNYLWKPSLDIAKPDTLLGRPIRTSSFMPTIAKGERVLLFGDMKNYWVADRQNRTFCRLNTGVTRAIQKIEVTIRQTTQTKRMMSTVYRIRFDGLDYDIKGIVPNFQTQDYMKLICESRKAGAKDDIY